MNSLKERKFIYRLDVWCIVILMAGALIGYMTRCSLVNKNGINAEILLGNKVVKLIRLDRAQNSEFRIKEKPNMVFCVENHAIGVKYSDCRGKICMQTGMIEHIGESISCIPNNVFVHICNVHVLQKQVK